MIRCSCQHCLNTTALTANYTEVDLFYLFYFDFTRMQSALRVQNTHRYKHTKLTISVLMCFPSDFPLKFHCFFMWWSFACSAMFVYLCSCYQQNCSLSQTDHLMKASEFYGGVGPFCLKYKPLKLKLRLIWIGNLHIWNMKTDDLIRAVQALGGLPTLHNL